MSNSSLLDPNTNTKLQTISANKQQSLATTSQNKINTLANINDSYVDPLARAESLAKEAYDSSVGVIDNNTYRAMVNTVASGNADNEQLSAYLRTKYKFTPEQVDYALNDIAQKAGKVSTANYEIVNRSEGLTGDLALGAVQGFQQNIALPVTGILAQAARFGSKVLPKETQDAVGEFTDNQLLLQDKAIKSLDKYYSVATKNALEDKNYLIAEFEATADKEYPNGAAKFFAGVLKSVEGFVDNPRLLAVETAKQTSNYLGAGLAGQLGKKVLTRGMSKDEANKWLKNEGKAQAEKMANATGIAYVTAQEGLSNGIQAKVDVLNKKHEELLKTSPDYAKLIDQGLTPTQAKRALSDTAFDIAFAVSAATGALTSWGLKTGKMEAQAFEGTNIISSTVREGLEEGIQGTGGQFSQNLAAQQTTDPNTALDKGLGVAAGEGAILGGVMGGGMSATSSLLDGSLIKQTGKAIGSVAKPVANKINVAFNKSSNKFTAENAKEVLAGNYSNLKGNTIEEKVDSVLDTSTMANFDRDPTKIVNHVNKLAEVVSNEMESKLAELPETATQEEKKAAAIPYYRSMMRLEKMAQSVVAKAEKEAKEEPLPEDATDEQKAERLLSFNSLKMQDDPLFDELNNLSNSTSIPADKKVALKSLANVRQALNDLRSKGSDKSLAKVANDILKGSEDWRGIETYVGNILTGLKTKTPAISNFNLKELERFRDNRKTKYDLANVYVNAKTMEGRKVAEEAYMNAFGKSSANLRAAYEEGRPIVTPRLLEAIKFEYDSIESAYSGMANLVQGTRNIRAVAPVTQEATEQATAGVTQEPVQELYTAPVTAPEVTAVQEMDNADLSVPAEPIVDDQVEDVVVEEDQTEESTETEQEAVPLTKEETRTKRERIKALLDNEFTPQWARTALEVKGMTIAKDTIDKAEKAVTRNQERKAKADQDKKDREEVAAKVKEFKPEAYKNILSALITVSSKPKTELKAYTKTIVDKLKTKLEDKAVSAKDLLETAKAYAQGIKDAPYTDVGFNTNKTYLAGLKVGKSISKSASAGSFFLRDTLKNVKRPELNNMLISVGKTPVQEYMKQDKPLQYVIDELTESLKDNPVELNNIVEWLTTYVNTFDQTVRYKDPNWDSFSMESVQMLRNSDGSFSEALKVAFAVESFLWFNEQSSMAYDTREDVAKRFSKHEDDLTDKGYLELLKAGQLQLNINDSLSRTLLNYIGVGTASSINNTDVNNFTNSVGHLNLVVLENMGLLKTTLIDQTTFKSFFVQEEEGKSNKKVQLNRTGKEDNKIAFSDKADVVLVNLNYGNSDVSTYLELGEEYKVLEALESVFGTDKVEKVPSTTEPTMNDIPKKYKGTNQDIPEEVREAYLASAKRAWKVKEHTSFLVESFLTPEQVAVLQGGIRDLNTQPKFLRDGLNAKYNTLVAEAEASRKYLRDWKDKAMYLIPEAWRVGRTGYKNVLLNPQASKMARHWMGMDVWERDVDMSNPEQAELFQLALAFNLGIDIDKRDNPSEVIQELNKITGSDEFQQLVQAYDTLFDIHQNMDNEDYVSDGSDANAVSTLVNMMEAEAIGTPSWAKIEAIAEYSRMVKANGKPFKTTIMVEIDGITNGVMIANMLFGIYDKETLAKGGIYFEPSEDSDYVQWSKNSSNLDSYKTLAKFTQDQYKMIRSALIGLSDKVIKGIAGLSESEEKNFRRSLGIPSNKPLNEANIKKGLKIMRAAMQLAGSAYDENGLITKAWRKLSKEPLMTTNYGAGINRVVEKLVDEIITGIFTDIGKTNSKDSAKRRSYEIEQALSVVLGRQVYIPENVLEFELSQADLDTIAKAIRNSVGKPLEAALKSNYEAYNERKVYLQDVISTHEMIGQNKFDEAINKWRADNNKGLTEWPSKEYIKELFETLKDYFTVLPSAFSKDKDDGLTPNSIGTIKGDKLDQRFRGTSRSEMNYIDGRGRRVITTGFGRTEVTDAGVGSLAYVVQGIDGAIAIKLMEKYGIMNAHDGFGFAYDTVVEGTAFVNEAFVDVIRNHKLWEDIRAKHEAIIEAAETDSNIQEAAEKAGLLEMDINTSIKWEESKNKIIDDLYVVQQYYFPNSGYYPNGKIDIEVSENNMDAVADAVVNEMRAEAEGVFKSLDNANTIFTADKHITVTADNVVQVFEQLVQADMTQEDADHLNHLRTVLGDLVANVMAPVELEVASRDAVTSGEYKKYENKIELRVAKDSSRINPQQSVAEVLVHELGHHVVETNLAVDSKERQMIDRIYQAVKKAHPNAASMYPENATQEEKDLMDQIYDYVFKNTDSVSKGAASNTGGFAVDNTGNNYLSEFIMYALTNKQFIKMMNTPQVLKILNAVDSNTINATGRSFLGKGLNTAFDWAINTFKRMLTKINDKLYGLSGQLPSQMVYTLAGRLAGTTARSISKLDKLQAAQDKLNTATQKAVLNWVMKPLITYLGSARAKASRVPGVKTVSNLYGIYHARNIPKFRAAMRKITARIDLHEDSLARALWRDVQGRNDRNSIPMYLHRMANKFVDQLRINVRNSYVEHLRSLFKKELSKDDKAAVTSVVLETDLSVLIENGTTFDNLLKLLRERNTLNNTISTIRAELRSKFKNNSGYYINMAESMAYRMAGLSTTQYDTPFNAYMVARLAGNSVYKPEGDLLEAERLVDVLTTLESIKLRDLAEINSVVNLMVTEKEAMTSILDLHSQYKLESYKSLFKQNKALMIKGYVKEQFDPNVNLIYAPIDKAEELALEGYKPVGKVVQDQYDFNPPVVMFISSTSGLSRYNAGAVPLDGTNAKGADIYDVNKQRDDGTALLRFSTVRSSIVSRHHRTAGIEGRKANPKFEPVFNEDGNVVTYRYMMSKKDKIKLLDKNTAFDEIMAVSEASKSSKKNAEMISTKVVEWLWEDYVNNYASEPSQYIELSDSTKIQEHREMFAMLPTYMKDTALGYFKDGKIMVRKDEYRLLFGFRKWSVSELGKKQFESTKNKVIIDVVNAMLRSLNSKPVRTIEQALQELAAMFKDVIVVKTGATLIANIVSNLVTLMVQGVNPVDIVTDHIKGWVEVNKYQGWLRDNAEMELKLKGGRNLTGSERRDLLSQIQANKQRMLVSPVKDLVDEGIYQTITEDVADVDGKYTYSSKFDEWSQPLMNKVPNVLKDVGDMLFMTHNTRMYKFMRNSTQVSDFAARYVLHKHNMKKGMAVTKSLEEVVDMFVNYDLPTHKGVQYLNDMGFLLFTKYILRTQKVMLKMLRDRPASVTGLLLSQYMLGMNLPDMYDSNILQDNILMNRLNDPLDSLEGVIGIHAVGNGIM